MAAVSTTTEGMRVATELMELTHEVARNGVQTVSAAHDTLRRSWTGGASLAFDNAMKAWFDDCKIIMDTLGGMMAVMRDNRAAVTQGEADNASVAKSIPTGPGLPI